MAEQKKELQLWKENRAFFQATTFKGARYLDDTGKILNEYREYYHDGNVGVNGLQLLRPKTSDYPEEISVDMNRIWIACYRETPVKRITEISGVISKNISRILGVSLYTRLGFRVQYYRPLKDIKRYCHQIYLKIASPEFQSLIKTDSIAEMMYNIRYKSPPFFIQYILQPIVVMQPPAVVTDFSEDGFIIDLDISEDDKSSATTLNFDRLDRFLREASNELEKKALETMEFLGISD